MTTPAAFAAGVAALLAVIKPEPAAPDAGPLAPAKSQPAAQDSLGAAREKRLRVAAAQKEPAPDTAGIAADAQACAADARRSWSAQFPDAANAPDRVQALSLVGAAGAEALYLEAVCTATVARMQGFTPLAGRRAELIAAFTRVAQLAADLDGAGAERELGALYAALPTHAGGDLDAAKKHLLAAIERAPQDARNHLVLARTVAVKAQDRALFREQLQIALKCPDAQGAAQAEALLQRESELFGPEEAAQPIPGGRRK